jgi:excisionase family DNA binding protein
VSGLLTAPEAAARLRISVERLYDLVADGTIPARQLRPRGRLLFRPEDLEAALRPAPATGRPRAGDGAGRTDLS